MPCPEKIRNQGVTIPVIMFSGFDQALDELEVARLGVSRVISKPFVETELF